VNRDVIHRQWTPPDDPWSPWVKPVLFAHLNELAEPTPVTMPAAPPRSPVTAPVGWIRTAVIEPLLAKGQPENQPPGSPYRADVRLRDTAVVIDLPGAAGVRLGVSLVDYGFRPVPIYNAVPSPLAVVDLSPIMAALVDGAGRVSAVVPGSQPAFLVDSNRMSGSQHVRPGAFDNRSVCRATDFPSPEKLLQAGIRRALWIHGPVKRPGDDLEAVLVKWQRQGIALWKKDAEDASPAQAFELRRRAWPVRVFAALRRSVLRRRDDDAYGMIVPESSGG
jgi:hypothetical protein